MLAYFHTATRYYVLKELGSVRKTLLPQCHVYWPLLWSRPTSSHPAVVPWKSSLYQTAVLHEGRHPFLFIFPARISWRAPVCLWWCSLSFKRSQLLQSCCVAIGCRALVPPDCSQLQVFVHTYLRQASLSSQWCSWGASCSSHSESFTCCCCLSPVLLLILGQGQTFSCWRCCKLQSNQLEKNALHSLMLLCKEINTKCNILGPFTLATFCPPYLIPPLPKSSCCWPTYCLNLTLPSVFCIC